MKINTLREQNKLLKERIQELRHKKNNGPQLKLELEAFVLKSKDTIDEISQRSISQQQQNNRNLHEITQKYQIVLKQQISLLTANKHLSQKKDSQDKKLNQHVQKLTKQYESQIAEYQKKVKINVNKIQQLSGTNIIKRLIKNKKFKAVMNQRGCNLQGLEKQTIIQEVAQQVQEKDKLIEAAELKSNALDQELQKMQQLIETMRQLVQNMQKEKQNILKQNTILKEKLDQSEQLIGRLMGKNTGDQQGQENQGEQDQQGQNQEQKVNDQ